MSTWTAEKEAILRERYEAGDTFAVIADAVGLSLRNVQAKALRLGFTRRNVASRHADPEFLRLRQEGKSAKQIAAHFGVALKRVQHWISVAIAAGLTEKNGYRPTPVWSEQKRAELRRLWAAGHGPAAISRIMGRPLRSVQEKARALGLTGDRRYPATRKPAPPRDYKTAHLITFARKPRPQPTSTLWDKTETSRPFLERGRTECAWPLGERGDYHACCAPTMENDAYCEHHRLMAGGLKVPGVRIGDFKRAA